ncbi:transcription factor HES-2-like [Centruroides sculpturatus]|uniref:transcription factor HES-2-like n=2 Tax=Centruroides sculpturatus TaxID=218467 RepID=UPI000C6CE6C5|nr:transcription factor HES-2-like [Centruroides sculpturatus]
MAAQKEESTAAQRRKVTKPLMEKRRRARINHCLTELKRFLLATEGDKNLDNGRSSKLEKADILEMTVKYLRQISKQEKSSGENSKNERYQAGYRQCMGEVAKFVSITHPSLTAKFLDHLDRRLASECSKEDQLGEKEHLIYIPCKIQPEFCHRKPEMWRPW